MKFPVEAVAPQLLNVMTGLTPAFGPSPARSDVRFIAALEREVNQRLARVGKALPGLRVPENPFRDQFNRSLSVISDLDQLAVGGRLSLNEDQWKALVSRCVRELLNAYLNDPSREAL
jgi:hypothetical protein